MSSGHILAIPYPAQGHVIPLLEVSLCLAKHGFEVTFVNTEYNHKRVVSALAETNHTGDGHIHLVSLPDGMKPGEDRNDLGKLTETMLQVMPMKLEELINTINGLGGNEITSVIADENLGWALEVAEKMRIRRVAFWPAAAALLAMLFSIPKLIEEKLIDSEGTILKSEEIKLAASVPTTRTERLVWACIGDKETEKILFQVCLRNNKAVEVADWVICNTAYELEAEIFSLAPRILPIGPLLASNRLENSIGHFWPEDLTCLKWLAQQSPCSVIYVAFGSFTVLDKTQFQELALGLELTGRPFLWVVRPDITEENPNNVFPLGFQERIESRGKIVGWAPQQRVLSHPSIACFVSHCGWNSTLESLSNGIRFLCWPYFADQFLNESYICDIWKVGLKLKKDEHGIITRTEIKEKMEKLLTDEDLKQRIQKLKKTVVENVEEGGRSYNNFNNFINWLKT
ncbi:UDP-glycosyltransferase 83A1-like [Benincasa hispida]|uniref:UDP-glycosyltransferase 83A1-like n=1 Tax=Benincasa hispida TaxID=102211 RepID=UPI00190218F1|nr:UDP-glycosyltransferase 83A1-like [Benincasa hispida]